MSKPIIDLRSTLKRDFLGYEKVRTGRYVITIRREMISEAIQILLRKHRARFSALTAVDIGLDLELLYHMSIGEEYYNLKTVIPKEVLELPSITNIIPGANWSEREVQDLFGVEFKGHPDPRSLIVPFEWSKEKIPLRKPMKGLLSPFQIPTVENLFNQGLIFPLSGLIQRIRGELNLETIPPTTYSRPEDMKEVQRMIKAIKFDQKVGFD
ncbi:MAG: NADH-quinone oxidoreductase subunit C, partial [Candidatus Methylarchaceae archaeon HK01M]|nr:NADH-quinone oxidoreductase subunit C [Candidatus Methylarchaceae archaeon HK01M]